MVKEKVFTINMPQEQSRLKTLVTLMNGMLELTPRELEVVVNFLELNRERPCTTEDRKKVIEKMKLKNVQTLNNVIKSITKKRVFIRDNSDYRYCGALQNIEKVEKITINVQVV